MRWSLSHRAHLEQVYGNTTPSALPGGFRAGEAGTDDADLRHSVTDHFALALHNSARANQATSFGISSPKLR
jgi:hypothetical protein